MELYKVNTCALYKTRYFSLYSSGKLAATELIGNLFRTDTAACNRDVSLFSPGWITTFKGSQCLDVHRKLLA